MGVGIRHPNSPSVRALMDSHTETQRALAQLDEEEKAEKFPEYPDFPHTDAHGRRLLLCVRCLASNLENEKWPPRQAITVSPIHGAICLYHFLGSDNRVDI